MQAPKKKHITYPLPSIATTLLHPQLPAASPPTKKNTQATSRSKAKHQFATPRVGLGIVEPRERHVQSWVGKRYKLFDFLSKITMPQVCWHVAWVWFLIHCLEQRCIFVPASVFRKRWSASSRVSASKSCTQVPTVLSEREHSCETRCKKT